MMPRDDTADFDGPAPDVGTDVNAEEGAVHDAPQTYRPIFPISKTARQVVPQGWIDYIAVYAVFLGLQLIDLLTTFAVLSLGGEEGNPSAVAVLEGSGAWGLVALKIILVVATAIVWVPAVAWMDARPERFRTWGVLALNAVILGGVVFYAWIVVHNTTVLWRLL